MEVQFQIKYLEPKEIFINEINDDFLQVPGEKKYYQPILIAGTCTKINRANDFLAVFILEDPTLGHVVEVFRDKLPYDTEIEVGMKYKLKGIYTKNKFDEKIIRAFRLQRIDMNELYLFYLQVQSNRKNKFNEEEYLFQKSKLCDQFYIGREILESQGIKQIFSAVFNYMLNNYKQIQQQDCFVFKEQLMQIEDILQLKDQIQIEEQFYDYFDKAMQVFQENNIQTPFLEQKGYVVNINFFENFSNNFYAELEHKLQSNKDTQNNCVFQIKQVKKIMNNLLQHNYGYYINDEATLQFIYSQILLKKMYYKDKKNQNLTLFK